MNQYSTYLDIESALRFYSFCIADLKMSMEPKEWEAHVTITNSGSDARVTVHFNMDIEHIGSYMVNAMANYCRYKGVTK